MNNNVKKEYYIKKVKKYNKDLKLANATKILGCVTGALVSIRIALIIISRDFQLEPLFTWLDMGIIASIINSIAVITWSLIEKTEIKASISEIEEVLAQLGFNLNDEMNKGMGI